MSALMGEVSGRPSLSLSPEPSDVFGKPEERVRVEFSKGEGYSSLGTTIWAPLERQAEAEAFVADVNKAIESAGA
jgi:hypothetical protein